ncbi:a7b14899-023c-453a-83aa-70669c4a8e8e [Sclerotinia trifoliorum]|uniref:A7b14899-023c-453a-83aa-70669c4a8e8e n=1 Tax=Sclerotinia trifoliorum TaxID=28548 RepID=A0A8H2VV96_9HELO|nr:a7b14899-023c-453a-83aa-70669c4a8e8e [Sclerotinia trifoliorum]
MLVMSAHHNFISAFAVFAGGAQAIPGWNFAVYRSLGEAYTIRRYWGIVWHQFLRRDLIGCASFMSSNIFRIPQTSKYNKIAMLYLVFFSSACMHAMIYLPAKMRISGCGISHIFQWYSLCPCAIIAEDTAQKLGKKVLSHHGWRTDSRWCYWFGYLWVWAFFAWSLSKNVFPKDDCVP